jgi:hypothetical protein
MKKNPAPKEEDEGSCPSGRATPHPCHGCYLLLPAIVKGRAGDNRGSANPAREASSILRHQYDSSHLTYGICFRHSFRTKEGPGLLIRAPDLASLCLGYSPSAALRMISLMPSRASSLRSLSSSICSRSRTRSTSSRAISMMRSTPRLSSCASCG